MVVLQIIALQSLYLQSLSLLLLELAAQWRYGGNIKFKILNRRDSSFMWFIWPYIFAKPRALEFGGIDGTSVKSRSGSLKQTILFDWVTCQIFYRWTSLLIILAGRDERHNSCICISDELMYW